MTASRIASGHSPVVHPPGTPLGRFGILTLLDSPELFIGSMPMSGLLNPLTGAPSVGPLAVLVDFVAGLVNHHRRTPEEWTVSTELTLDVVPDCLAMLQRAPQVPVVASAHPLGRKGATSLGRCDITHQDETIGTGTVRSLHIRRPREFSGEADYFRCTDRPTDLVDIMSLRLPEEGAAASVLWQPPTPFLDNTVGVVHGGVAAAGLELVGSAALNPRGSRQPMATASVHVNYLRRFVSGDRSRYEGRALHSGNRSGVAEAKAISDSGEPALMARITAYA